MVTNSYTVFSKQEYQENVERQQKLTTLIKTGQALLIVGAGSSARLQYPSWQILLTELEALADESGPNFPRDTTQRENDPLGYAEQLKTHIRSHFGSLDRYFHKIDQLYRPQEKRCDDFHKALLRLPFRAILTTNYDVVLECAASDLAEEQAKLGKPSARLPNYSLVIGMDAPSSVSRYLLSANHTEHQRRIAHIHGKHDLPDSIVLSRDDYRRFYGDNQQPGEKGYSGVWTIHRKLLWSLLATRNVVFVGFSMDDIYLNEMLKIVSDDLWRWGETTHYAIMDISTATAKLAKLKQKQLDSYGIGVVFYEVVGGSYEGLKTLMTELEASCGTIPKPMSPAGGDSGTAPDVPIDLPETNKDSTGDWRQRLNTRYKKMMTHED